MAVTIEIAYFNSIVIAGGQLNYVNGQTPGTQKQGVFHIEENRIKGEFNGKQMDLGPRAYITDEKYQTQVRANAMIHSGIFNARTDFNELNQFPVGEEITRAVDISHGSIQKLYAEETNLNIFQENKVSRALIDKDIIYTAEGQGLTTAGAKVISQITPYTGKYGISKNPESFAVFGNRKYFADKNRGTIMRLAAGQGGGQGLTPISQSGMQDFFKDHLFLCDKIYGAFDEQKGKYVVSLQGSSVDGGKRAISTGGIPTIQSPITGYRTLCYDDKIKGWTSFFTYKPTFGFSLKNEFYTFNNVDLYKHYDTSVPRGNFYGADFSDPSYIKFVFNDQPGITKTFATINYEGTSGWEMSEMKASESTSPNSSVLEAYIIPKEGTLDGSNTIGFVKKEDKYFSEIRNKATDFFYDNSHFNSTGVKGYYVDVTMQYWSPTASAGGTKQELFSVGTEAIVSSK